MDGRTDTAARLVRAAPAEVWRAFVDPDRLVRWLPPTGMRAEIEAFDPRPGGAYRLALIYEAPHPTSPGKTSEHVDRVVGAFVELVPHRRIVQRVTFDAADPALAGAMTIIWSLAPAEGGTEVAVACTDVPAAIGAADHAAGLRSTLRNLAALVE